MRRTNVATPGFAAQARLLRGLLERHVTAEQGGYLRAARRLLPPSQLLALGAGMRRRHEELLGLDARSGGSVWRGFTGATEWGQVPPLS